ncbi:MAG: formylglycine-generating enzyme family protein [Phycisphaerae bacterium]|nr:formylglycine-generating enzyme family protein [Phycisphaerae bacterium]
MNRSSFATVVAIMIAWALTGCQPAGDRPGGAGAKASAFSPVSQRAGHQELQCDLRRGVAMQFTIIPAGTFTMGSPDGEQDRRKDEGPRREVTLRKPLCIGMYEVTQRQYQAVMGTNPSRFKGDDNPVDSVSWSDAVAFCRKLSAKTGGSFRLPTEAEWEYACRAGSTSRFNGCDADLDLGAFAWHGGNSEGKTHPVGLKKPNAFGLYDMHGNVWEWCGDWYSEEAYKAADRVDPRGPSAGSFRVIRGGSWGSYPKNCRSALRHWITPTDCSNVVGFRVVIDGKW